MTDAVAPEEEEERKVIVRITFGQTLYLHTTHSTFTK